MKLNPEVFSDALRVLCGEIISPIEAVNFAERLDSEEELFAWILLRKSLLRNERELTNQIIAKANSIAVNANTRRQNSDFQLSQRKVQNHLCDTLEELLRAQMDASQLHERARVALVDFELYKTSRKVNYF